RQRAAQSQAYYVQRRRRHVLREQKRLPARWRENDRLQQRRAHRQRAAQPDGDLENSQGLRARGFLALASNLSAAALGPDRRRKGRNPSPRPGAGLDVVAWRARCVGPCSRTKTAREWGLRRAILWSCADNAPDWPSSQPACWVSPSRAAKARVRVSRAPPPATQKQRQKQKQQQKRTPRRGRSAVASARTPSSAGTRRSHSSSWRAAIRSPRSWSPTPATRADSSLARKGASSRCSRPARVSVPAPPC